MKKLLVILTSLAIVACSAVSANVSTNKSNIVYSQESGTQISRNGGNSNLNYSKESGMNGTINIGGKQSAGQPVSN